MGRRGPIPKTAAQKRLTGNPGKRPIADRLELPPGTPDAPPWLGKLAREIWDYTVAALKDSIVLALADRDALARYCVAQAQVERLTAACERLKFVDEADNKVARLHAAALRTASDLAQQLYLTPAARSRANVDLSQREPDPFELFLDDKQSKPRKGRRRRGNVHRDFDKFLKGK
jgi:P27 family predicted phage terminase small subunit